MVIPESKYHTIRTLHALGFNRLTIASAIGVPKSTLYDHFSEIITNDLIKDKGKVLLPHYKNSSFYEVRDRCKDAGLKYIKIER